MGLRDFTQKQWLTIVVIAIADFCNAICVALQAPFYPQEVCTFYLFLEFRTLKGIKIKRTNEPLYTFLSVCLPRPSLSTGGVYTVTWSCKN